MNTTKNNSMLIALTSILLFLTILTFPMPFEIKASFDAIKNSGTVSCFFGKIKLLLSKVSIEEKGILLKINHSKKLKKYVVDKKKLIFVKHLSKNLFKILALRNFYLATRFGFCDAFYSPIISSSIESLITCGLINLKNKKPHSEISYASSQNSFNYHFAFSISTRCFISPVDILKGMIKAKIMQKKELKLIYGE